MVNGEIDIRVDSLLSYCDLGVTSNFGSLMNCSVAARWFFIYYKVILRWSGMMMHAVGIQEHNTKIQRSG